MTDLGVVAPRVRPRRKMAALPFLVLLVLAAALPLTGNEYWGIIATRAAIYWVLVSGLNLVVGYGGQLAIGYVSLLTLGAYTTAVLCQRFDMGMLPALAVAGAVGAVFGVLVGLPALRLRTFYFAMATLGFATIVTQVALAWTDVTGGGVGVPGPALPAPFDTSWGFYAACLSAAALCTWLTANIARSRFGRGLVAIRDAEVAAEAYGVSKPVLFIAVFLFSGAVAGVAGGLFADLQTYITPDAFTFDLSVLFFIAILVGGRNSILGPLIATILLTILPEVAAPLVAWSTFLYAVLLLVIVVAVPGGIADMLDIANRRPLERNRAVVPRPTVLAAVLPDKAHGPPLAIEAVRLNFGGLRAIDDLTLDLRAGEVHGLIGPNGSGKTTTLNVICGFATPQRGRIVLGDRVLPLGQPQTRAAHRIARTFQTPRIIGEVSVLDNVMVGGTVTAKGSFVEAMLSLPRQRRDEAELRERAMLALHTIGLESLAAVRCDRLQHSELRFLEIARALMLRPDFLLLDEPAAGLSPEEIRHLAALVRGICARGTGVLLVEHHADLIFDLCDRVTVLNLGRVLAAGTPAEIRAHREVVSAYLGDETPLLDVSGVVSGYGKIVVLHGIDFVVRPGELVALLGPNGAGKTTLLRTISGLLPVGAGTVRFAGEVLGRDPRQATRVGISHVIEGHRVFPQLPILDNMLLAGFDLPRRERLSRVDEALAWFPEIASRRAEKAGALSGGQQQMLAVAQGLVRRPRLLLLDEPSAGLSPVLVDRVFSVAAKLRDGGTAVVLVEQLIEKALGVADRVVALARGRVVLEAPAAEPGLPERLESAYFGEPAAA